VYIYRPRMDSEGGLGRAKVYNMQDYDV